ncbi:MAG: hypothetical protein ACREO5_00575 [Candidatus Binatia bacterium]
MKKSLLALLMLVVPPASAFDDPEDFRGLKWDASESEALRLFPELRKLQTARSPSRPPGTSLYSLLNVKLGDIAVNIGFGFMNGQFAHALISFPDKDFSAVEAAFIERYGPPTTTMEETLTTGMGVKYRNRKHRWVGEKILIYLDQYFGKITTGLANLTTKEYFAAFGANRDKRSQAF